MHESTLRRDDTSDLHPLLHGLSEFFNLVQGAPTRGDLGVRVRVTSSTRLSFSTNMKILVDPLTVPSTKTTTADNLAV